MTEEGKRVSEEIAAVADRIMSLGLTMHGITEAPGGRRTYTSDVIQEALLFDIARSLRTIKTLIQCPNVAQAVRDVNLMGKIARKKLRRKKPCRT